MDNIRFKWLLARQAQLFNLFLFSTVTVLVFLFGALVLLLIYGPSFAIALLLGLSGLLAWLARTARLRWLKWDAELLNYLQLDTTRRLPKP